MILELIIWTLFVASSVALVLWILISPPADKKTRQSPENEEAYAKQRFIPSKVPSDVDAIVIGAGMGGGTAASILSKFGKKVVVLEHHDKLGLFFYYVMIMYLTPLYFAKYILIVYVCYQLLNVPVNLLVSMTDRLSKSKFAYSSIFLIFYTLNMSNIRYAKQFLIS